MLKPTLEEVTNNAMHKRFNSVLALCKTTMPFVQAPNVSKHKGRNLKLNPTVISALRDLYTQSDPTSFQRDLSTTHLVFTSVETILLYLIIIVATQYLEYSLPFLRTTF